MEGNNGILMAILLVLALLLPQSSAAENIIKVFRIDCDNVNPAFVANNHTCTLLVVNKDKNMVNLEAWVVRELRNISLQLQVLNLNTGFMHFLISTKWNFCNLMSGKMAKSLYHYIILRLVEDNTNVLHECPISGFVYGHELWVDMRKLKFYIPQGKFKLHVAVYEHAEYLGRVDIFFESYVKVKNRTRG